MMAHQAAAHRRAHPWLMRTRRALSASQEVELSRQLLFARKRALAIAVDCPGAAALVVQFRQELQAGADVWAFVKRTHGPMGKCLQGHAAKQLLNNWFEKLEAGERSTLPGVLEGAMWLTEYARKRLVSTANDTLSSLLRGQMQQSLRCAEEARARYVYSNQGLVVQQASRYRYAGMSMSDLVQEGNLGLMRAIDKYDPEQGCRFSTYAVWWIRQSMRRALSNQSRTIRLPVHVYGQQLKLRYAWEQLEREGYWEPSNEALAERSGLELDTVCELRALVGEPCSLDVASREGGVPLGEKLPDPTESTAFGEVVLKGERRALRGLLAELTERERAMLEMRYGLKGQGAHTLRQVGEHFGVTRERVRQIINNCLICLRGRANRWEQASP